MLHFIFLYIYITFLNILIRTTKVFKSKRLINPKIRNYGHGSIRASSWLKAPLVVGAFSVIVKSSRTFV